MKIDAQSLLEALKISVPRYEESVNTRCYCPIHNDTEGTMLVMPNQVTGNIRFVCSHPSCGFSGDAISLVAKLKKISVKDAIQLFSPCEELADTLKEPLSEVELYSYIEGKNTQSKISEYLNRCSQALRCHPEKSNLRAGLSVANLRLIPDTLGLLLIDDNMPSEFHEFRKQKYAKSTLICCPHTFNDEITHVDVYDASCPTFKYTVNITRSDIGVYLESTTLPAKILATEDAYVASMLFGNARQETIQTPPIYSISGFPLPEAYSTVKTITFVSTGDYPLSLDFALDILKAPNIVSGTAQNPLLEVFVTENKAGMLKASGLRAALAEYPINGIKILTVSEYVVEKLHSLCKQNKLQAVSELLNRKSLPKILKMCLINDIRERGYEDEIVDLLSDVSGSLSDITLANGKSIKIRPTELVAITKNGLSTLCNVGITVSHKIRAFDGEEILVCVITPQDTDIAPVRVNLPEKIWGNPDLIKKTVSKAFTARGQVPYIAFYRVFGFKWDDILAKMAEKCPLSREIASLGCDEVADFNMPEFVIHPMSHKLDPQDKVFTLPDNVLRAYSGIPCIETINCLDPIKKLLQNCENLYVAAFTCGLMHVIYQMSSNFVGHVRSLKQAIPKHLFFVETESGIWGGVFKQLADLFSGNDFTPTISYADPSSTLENYKQLGTLPLIAYVPSMGPKLAQAIDSHTVSVIGLVDSTTAVMTNGHIAATYLVPSNEQPVNARLATENIEAIRECFASFLATYLNRLRITKDYRSAACPCLAAYEEVCKLCNTEPSQNMKTIAMSYFPGIGLSGVNMFFDFLHRGIIDDRKQTHICVLNEAPQKGYSFTGRGQHVFVLKDRVIIGHNVVDLVNKASDNTFAIDQLSQELSERQLLEDIPEDLNLDPKRCWCIPRDVWQKDIIRPPVQLLEPLTNNVVELPPLSDR